MHRKQWIFDMDGTLTDSHDRGVAGRTAGAAAPLWPHRKTRHPRCSAEHGDGGGAEYLIRTYDLP